MNNKRRTQLKQVYNEIEVAKDALSDILDDESDYLNNIPENLQGSERFEKSENAVSNLEEAINDLENVLSGIEEAMS